MINLNFLSLAKSKIKSLQRINLIDDKIQLLQDSVIVECLIHKQKY